LFKASPPDDPASRLDGSGPAADLDRSGEPLACPRRRLNRSSGGPSLSTLLFHKPYGVLSQFTPEPGSRWECLSTYIDRPGVYAAGLLDADSEGLLVLTSDGRLQKRLTDPRHGHWRRYRVQVEGIAEDSNLEALRRGVLLPGGLTRPARVRRISDPGLGERKPPIRYRRSIPTSWLELELQEGRNRQVRRMTASVGLPTLRLVRVAIDLMDGGPCLGLDELEQGEWRETNPQEDRRLRELSGLASGTRMGEGTGERISRSRR